MRRNRLPSMQNPSLLKGNFLISVHEKAPIRGIYYTLTCLNNYIYTQRNVSKCGGIGHKYVSEYVSKPPSRPTTGRGFSIPQSTIPQNVRNVSAASGTHGEKGAKRAFTFRRQLFIVSSNVKSFSIRLLMSRFHRLFSGMT